MFTHKRTISLFCGTLRGWLLNSPDQTKSDSISPRSREVTTAATSPSAPTSPGLNERILFWASFATLIAAGIGFSVRGVQLLKDWGNQFGFTQTELGTITGGGLVGFGLAIIFFSFCADRFGYGKLMLVAFLFHTLSAVVTLAATPVFGMYGKEGAFWCLNLGMWLFALGNGTCEAVINPLTATLFPKNKTHWLNILHAGWPLGLILGAVIMLGFKQIGGTISWEYKLGVFLIPVLIYGGLMLGRPFPKSEAQSAGVPLTGMMKNVGMLGFTLGAALIGLALAKLLPEVVGPMLKIEDTSLRDMILRGIGWGAAVAVWLAFGYITNFSLGSWILAFLYLLHALVGYVELGTDGWITNITERVLNSERDAMLAFIWTSSMMFILRFFAGPIVHRINPIGLLFGSACLGTLGLYLLGQKFTDTVWPWVAAVTVYGLGKTFYWPTLLGVISERFPKGGALALGLSGGVGMIGAGILGGPGIGYKQDYFAVEKLQQTTEGKATYQRYVARNDDGTLDEKGFPIVTDILPTQVPKIAGVDNSKLKVFEDYNAGFDEENKLKSDTQVKLTDESFLGIKGEGVSEAVSSKLIPLKNKVMKKKDLEEELGKLLSPVEKEHFQNVIMKNVVVETTLESDLDTLKKAEPEGMQTESKLKKNLTKLHEWWIKEGKPNYEKDKRPLLDAKLYGAKTALLYTAAIPAVLAIGFLILILYFAATGGYKQVHLEDTHPPMEEY
jgi:MFS family permease